MARKTSPAATGHTILVVDDQEETLQSVQRLLERCGHRVLTAASGEQGLQLFLEHDVDLMLVDFVMPRMDGKSLIRRIRSLDPLVPIILQTGYSGDQPPSVALAELGVHGYHDKADDPEKLMQWIAAGLNMRRLVRSLETTFRQRRGSSQGTILLIDADESCAEVHQHVANEGYHLRSAADVPTALAMLGDQRFGVVIASEDALRTTGAEPLRRLALESGTALIVYGGPQEEARRHALMRQWDLHGFIRPGEGRRRVLALISSAMGAARRIEAARAETELRSLLLVKFCHDLRTPLHVVSGYSEILKLEISDPRYTETLERLEAASRSALTMAEDYLGLASLDLTAELEFVDLDAFVADLHAFAEKQIDRRSLRLATSVSQAGTWLRTDRRKLYAILAELLANAIRCSAEGEIRLDIRVDSAQTEFEIVDRGPAPPGTDRAYDGSSRPASPSADPCAPLASAQGRGVGLAIASRLSSFLGAAVEIRAGERCGAVSTLTLPGGAIGTPDGSSPVLH